MLEAVVLALVLALEEEGVLARLESSILSLVALKTAQGDGNESRRSKNRMKKRREREPSETGCCLYYSLLT